jgi:hypothetical protein
LGIAIQLLGDGRLHQHFLVDESIQCGMAIVGTFSRPGSHPSPGVVTGAALKNEIDLMYGDFAAIHTRHHLRDSSLAISGTARHQR